MLHDSSSSNTTVKHWFAEFKMGRTNTTDDPCIGRPIEVTTYKKLKKNLQNRFGSPLNESERDSRDCWYQQNMCAILYLTCTDMYDKAAHQMGAVMVKLWHLFFGMTVE